MITFASLEDEDEEDAGSLEDTALEEGALDAGSLDAGVLDTDELVEVDEGGLLSGVFLPPLLPPHPTSSVDIKNKDEIFFIISNSLRRR